MLELLRAGFARLWKDKIFWLCMALCAGYSAVSVQGSMQGTFTVEPDLLTCVRSGYYSALPLVLLNHAAFVSLFLGQDYACGTIRNKIVAGHSRTEVYLSNFVLCLVGDLLLLLGWLLGGAYMVYYVGRPSVQFWQELAALVLATAAITALLVLLNMAFANRAVMAVLSLLLIGALMVCLAYFNAALAEPEVAPDYKYTLAGELVFSGTKPNSHYVGGAKRVVYEFASCALPGGPMLKLAADLELTAPALAAAMGSAEPDVPAATAAVAAGAALCETAALTAAGTAVFKRKDIK